MANSYLNEFKPSDWVLGGVDEFLIVGAAWLLGALACVRKGPATDEVVPAETEPMLIYDSEVLLLVPLFRLEVSLTSSALLARFRSFFFAKSSAFYFS